MGLLSSIKKAVSSTVKTVSNVVKSTSSAVANVVKAAPAAAKQTANIAVSIASNPVGAVKAVTSGTSAKSFAKSETSKPLSQQITQTVVTGLEAIGVTVAAGAVAAGGVSALIPATVTGKIAAGTGVLIGGGAIIAEPLATTEAIVQVPQSLANVGGNIAEFAANPSLDSAANIVKENPVTSGLLAAGAAVAVGAGVSTLVASTVNTLATKENTAALKAGNVIIPAAVPAGETSGGASTITPTGSGLPITATNPTTPETVSLSETKTKAASKKRSKARREQINQKVNIIMSQNNSEKYLNRRVQQNEWQQVR
jgi:hypothetical protein